MVKVLTVSAGHGGFGVTPGKRGPDGKVEWEWNNVVVVALMAHITANYEGIKVIRVDDPTGRTDVPLTTRTNRANAAGSDLHVDVHHNAMGSKWFSNGGGIETYVMSPKSANPNSTRAAEEIHKRYVKAMGLRDRGIKAANFHMLRETNMPAVLTEGGFMDSRVDRAVMDQPSKLKDQGEAIAEGAATYLKLKKKEVSVPDALKVLKPKLSENGEIGQAVIKQQGLTLREGPGTEYEEIRKLGYNSVYNVYEIKDQWYNLGGGQWASNVDGAYMTFTPAIIPPKENKPAPKEEEDEMLKQAIVINSLSDYPSAEIISVRSKIPIYPRRAIDGVIAKELIVVGGDKEGLKADKITVLAGKDRFETAKKVEEYIRK